MSNLNDLIEKKLGISQSQIVTLDELLYQIDSSIPEIISESVLEGKNAIDQVTIKNRIMAKLDAFLDETLSIKPDEIIKDEHEEIFDSLKEKLAGMADGFTGVIDGKSYNLRNPEEAKAFGQELAKVFNY